MKRLFLTGVAGGFFILALSGLVFAAEEALTVTFSETQLEVYEKGALIKWKTDIPIDGSVTYGKKGSSQKQWAVSGCGYYATEHCVSLGGLMPDTEYWYILGASRFDSIQQKSITKESETFFFRTKQKLESTVTVSDVHSSTTATTATITYKTNIAIGTAIDYGIEYDQYSNLPNTVVDDQEAAVTLHTATIKNLKPDTEYKARVRIFNSAQDTVNPFTFRTIADAPAEILSLTAIGGDTLRENYGTTISWSSKNAVSCTASGDWPAPGERKPSGSEAEYPDNVGLANYTLVCYNAAGEASAPVSYTPFIVGDVPSSKQGAIRMLSSKVEARFAKNTKIVATTNTAATIAAIAFFEQTASPADHPHVVAYRAPAHAIAGTRITFDLNDTSQQLLPGRSYVYTITVQGQNGRADLASLRDTIEILTLGKQGPITLDFDASEKLVIRNKTTRFTWKVSNADTCESEGPYWYGSRNPEGGSETVAIDDTGTFTMTCKNSDTTKKASVKVAVSTEDDPPTVSLSADNYRIKKGEQIRLSWETNAAGCQSGAHVLQNGILEWEPDHEWSADTGVRKTSGAQTLRPPATTRYYLNCFGTNNKQTYRTLVVTVDGKQAPYEGPAIKLSSVKVFDQGDPTTQYITYDYGYTPVGTLYETLVITKKNTGTVVANKRIPDDPDGPPATSTSVSGLEPLTAYRYVVTLIDPSDGRQAVREGDFTTGAIPKKEEPVRKTEPKKEEQKKEESKKTELVKEQTKEATPPPQSSDQQVADIVKKAKALQQQKFDSILSELQQLRDKVKEQESEIKYLQRLTADVGQLTVVVKESLNNFVTYGVDKNTQALGAGERAAVAHSYKAAYNRLPQTDKELSDMIKIANGRFPSERNAEAEKGAITAFKQSYKRVPNVKNNQNDVAAVMVMAYGLRQGAENRNLVSEQRGAETFRSIFGKTPQTTEEWNIMQAITYSGATRKSDADKDLFADEDEKIFGTDPNKPDSDGDGFIDGLEVENYYDPKKATGGARIDDAGWLLPRMQ